MAVVAVISVVPAFWLIDVDVEEEGELPDVDIDIDVTTEEETFELPTIEVTEPDDDAEVASEVAPEEASEESQ